MRELTDWTVEDWGSGRVGATMTFTKREPAGVRSFVVKGTGHAHDDGWTGGTFETFEIDGREPTDEECDEYSDELRAVIRDVYEGR